MRRDDMMGGEIDSPKENLEETALHAIVKKTPQITT